MTRILVVGKGGREHALNDALSRSPGDIDLYAFPGSDAICEKARKVEVQGLEALGEFMRAERIDLCVGGEESYLVKGEGLAAVCRDHGVLCWGPPKASAQLEASKIFAKRFMERHGIPTAAYSVAKSRAEALEQIGGYPVVLKFDGLAAGKGVAVCRRREEAEEFLEMVFGAKRFGEGELLVEACMEGPELSVFAAISDDDYLILSTARDYKRAGDGDMGPNTGGMGAVARRAGLVDLETMQAIEETVVAPTVSGLVEEGLPYRGFLYFGLMLTRRGPRLLEYNCRFGDPEAQAVMPLISGDFAGFLTEAASGELKRERIGLSDDWSVGVVLASAGYPASSSSGDTIEGLASVSDDVQIFHAGTKRTEDGSYVTNGGRVLSVVAQGANREEAVEKAYREVRKIDFSGRQMRTDIGQLHF